MAQPMGGYLRLGRLAEFYETSAGQLPAVLVRRELDPETVTGTRWPGHVDSARLWLFALPSGQVTAAFTLDVDTGMMGTIPLLEDLYYAELSTAGTPISLAVSHLAAEVAGLASDVTLTPERHQLVFAPADDPGAMPDDDMLQRMVYRADLPARNGSSAIRYPGELNRRPTTRAALGPYVSVLVGLQDYVENAALLSAVQVVAASARLRQIRESAYAGVATLRSATAGTAPVKERRLDLERLSNTLRSLTLDLSYSVEAASDLGMLVPALRVESYHEALIESMNLDKRAQTTGRMLQRLDNALDAELTSVQSVEARADDARRVRTVAAVTFVTTVGGTIGLLFAFLGINAREVAPTRSMFDHHYLPIYFAISFIALAGVALFIGLAWRERHRGSRPPTRDAPPLLRTRPGSLESG